MKEHATGRLSSVVKSDTVAVLPRYPRYYHGNGYKFYGIANIGFKIYGNPVEMGTKLAVPVLPQLWGWIYLDCELMHELAHWGLCSCFI